MPQPRIRSVPQYTRTSGPDAVELGRSIGLIADLAGIADRVGDVRREVDQPEPLRRMPIHHQILGLINLAGGLVMGAVLGS